MEIAVIAVIADIVGSRRLRDRAAAQAEFDRAVAQAEADLPLASQRLRPTVGDEFQARYATLDDALASLLLVQLLLPEGHDLRFGIGIGEIREIETGHTLLLDGSAWWAARTAIETVQARQVRALPSMRTWIVGAPEEDETMSTAIGLANAYVLARDEIVAGMTERTRRLTYGRCLGRTQSALAAAEGVSQPAVSQALHGAGAAAVVAGFDTLRDRAGR